MPTIEDISSGAPTLTCPLCNAPLDPARPGACPKCDWVAKEVLHAGAHRSTFRDRASVALSVVPGLGHIYKGYKMTGAIYMIGAVFAAFACVVVASFTALFGLLLLPIYWVAIMVQVYYLPDKGITPPPKPV